MSAVMARHYYVRGREALLQGQLDDACRDLEAAVQMYPHFCEARVDYATTLLSLGQAARAVQTLRVGADQAQAGRERAYVLRALGGALIATGDYAGAEQVLGAAGAEGGEPGEHAQLALLHGRSGRYAQAFAELLLSARRP
jgi:thioredoxin-like negative regulator of GroEL